MLAPTTYMVLLMMICVNVYMLHIMIIMICAQHDVHMYMKADYGVPPGASRPGGPWPDGIG